MRRARERLGCAQQVRRETVPGRCREHPAAGPREDVRAGRWALAWLCACRSGSSGAPTSRRRRQSEVGWMGWTNQRTVERQTDGCASLAWVIYWTSRCRGTGRPLLTQTAASSWSGKGHLPPRSHPGTPSACPRPRSTRPGSSTHGSRRQRGPPHRRARSQTTGLVGARRRLRAWAGPSHLVVLIAPPCLARQHRLSVKFGAPSSPAPSKCLDPGRAQMATGWGDVDEVICAPSSPYTNESQPK